MPGRTGPIEELRGREAGCWPSRKAEPVSIIVERCVC